MKYSVVGLGKLGLPLALLLSKCGVVTGIDSNPELVKALQSRTYTSTEPGVNELLEQCKGFTATTSFASVQDSDATFIVVPTPSTPAEPAFSNQHIVEAFSPMMPFLTDRKDYHLIVVVSTVMPGSMEKFKSLLEGETGKTCGKDFGLCYNPEFVALGDVVRGMTYPDAVLIGQSDPRAGDMLEQIYGDFYGDFFRKDFLHAVDNGDGTYSVPVSGNPLIRRMSLANAEVAKLALNVFVTMKISMANVIAQVCEKIPGGDVDAVTGFMGADSRIGRKYLTGGLGFGGPCFPRDIRAFKQLLLHEGIPDATAINDTLAAMIVERIKEIVPQGSKVAILGLSYKPYTPVIEESASLNLIAVLELFGYEVAAYDPLSDYMKLPDGLTVAKSVEECLEGADLCIVATPCPEFKKIQDAFGCMRKARVLDCWRILDRQALIKAGVEYHAVGVNDG